METKNEAMYLNGVKVSHVEAMVNKCGCILPLSNCDATDQWTHALATFREAGLSVVDTKEFEAIKKELEVLRTCKNNCKH